MDRRLPERTAWMRRAPIAIGVALWTSVASAGMDPESRAVPLAPDPAPSAGASVAIPVAVTLLSVGLACALWLRRRCRARSAPEGSIAVIDRAPMGRGRSLALVRVGDRVVLVGESAQGFQRLAEFEATDGPATAFEARRLAS